VLGRGGVSCGVPGVGGVPVLGPSTGLGVILAEGLGPGAVGVNDDVGETLARGVGGSGVGVHVETRKANATRMAKRTRLILSAVEGFISVTSC
jgi:hypothetical protein